MAAVSGQNPVFVNGLVVHPSRWTGSFPAVLADVTTSGTRGTRYAPVITDCSWQIEIPFDDSAFAEAAGLGTGAVITELYLRETQTTGKKLQFTTVESIDEVSDGKDVVRLTIRGKGGAYSANVSVPDVAVYPLPTLGS